MPAKNLCPAHGEIETEAVVDPEWDRYERMHVGWDGVRRIHGSVVGIDIADGKVWVQDYGTSRPVAEELVAARIPSGVAVARREARADVSPRGPVPTGGGRSADRRRGSGPLRGRGGVLAGPLLAVARTSSRMARV